MVSGSGSGGDRISGSSTRRGGSGGSSSRSSSAPVHWYTGTPIHWCTSTPVHRYTGTPVHRCTVLCQRMEGCAYFAIDSAGLAAPPAPPQEFTGNRGGVSGARQGWRGAAQSCVSVGRDVRHPRCEL